MTRKRLPLNRRQLEGIAVLTMKCLNISKERSIGIAFMNDTHIRMLNRKYLALDKTTDVLAFEYSPQSADIAISLETARRNATAYKSSYKDEVIRYIIHGLLHVFGYDDTAEPARNRMWRTQEELCKKIWLSLKQKRLS